MSELFNSILGRSQPITDINLDARTILDALDDDTIRYINFQYRSEHTCFLQEYDMSCRFAKQSWLNGGADNIEHDAEPEDDPTSTFYDPPFHTYEQYLIDPREMEVFRNAMYATPAWLIGLATLPRPQCNIWDLVKLHNLLPEDGFRPADLAPMTGLLFWRLFKRMYYSRVRSVMSRCVYRSIAHVFDLHDHHPSVMEDAVRCLWKAHHPSVPLGKTPTHQRIFKEDQCKWKLYRVTEGLTLWEHHMEVIPKYRAIRTWKQRKAEKWTQLRLNYKNRFEEILEDDVTLPEVEHTRMYFNGVEDVPEETPKDSSDEEEEEYPPNPAQMLSVRALGSLAQAHVDERVKTAADELEKASQLLTPAMKSVMEIGQTFQSETEKLFGTMQTETTQCTDLFKQQIVNIERLLQELKDKISHDTTEVKEVIQESIGTIANEIEMQVRTIGQVASQGTAGVYTMIGRKTLMVCEAFALYVTKKYLPPWLWCVLLGLTVVRWFGLTDFLCALTTWIYDTISSQFCYGARDGEGHLMNPAEAEGDGDWTSLMTTSISSVIFGMVNMSIYKTLPEKNKTERFLKTIDSNWRINRGIEHMPKLFEKLNELVERSFQLIVGDAIPTDVAEARALKPKYEKWSAEVAQLNRYMTEIDIERHDAERERILRLRDEGQLYVQLFDRDDMPGRYKYMFQNNLRIVTELAKKCELVKTIQEFRFDPWCIWVSGRTRIGKSYLCDHLHLTLAQILNVPLHDSKYAMGLADHMDGYHGQPIITIDDAGQWLGTFAEEKVREFMQMRTNHPMITKQADLKDKGRPFESKAIICSSNFTYPNVSLQVRDEEAFRARRHLVVEAHLVDAFKRGEDPDEEAIAEANRGNWEFPHLRFTLKDPVRNETIPDHEYLTFARLKQIIEVKFRAHIARQNDLIAKRRDHILAVIARRAEQEPNPAEAEPNDGEQPSTSRGPTDTSTLLRKSRLENVNIEEHDILLQREFLEQFPTVVIGTEEFWELPASLWEAVQAVMPNEDGSWTIKPQFQDQVSFFAMRTIDKYLSGVMSRLHAVGSAGMSRNIINLYGHVFADNEELKRVLNEASSAQYLAKYLRIKDLQEFASRSSGYREVRDQMSAFWNRLPTRESIAEGFSSGRYFTVLKENAKMLAFVGGIVGMAVAAYKMMSDTTLIDPETLPEDGTPPKTTPMDTTPRAAEAYASDKTPRGRTTQTKGPGAKPAPANPGQGAKDDNALELWRNRFRAHQYVIRSKRGKANALAFDGHNLLVPYHVVHGLTVGDNVALHGVDGLSQITFAFDPRNLVRLDSQDVAVIRDIVRLPPGPALAKHFVREKDLFKYKKFEGMLARIDISSAY